MPKLKTKSGAAKRFRKLGGGGIKRTQAFLRHILTKKSTKRKTRKGNPELNEISEELGDYLDTRVKIEGSANKGKIVIEYSGGQDLQRIIKEIKS